jgi:NAD(P) transhydrogenase subunit alpha
MLRITVPRESTPGENRVALIPETVGKLVKSGLALTVETGAGFAASHTDAAYRDAGATLAPDFAAACAEADLVLKVNAPTDAELPRIREGAAIVAMGLSRDASTIESLTRRKLSAFAMELIPRTTRAQRMDALSSMASIAGYKATLIAAEALGKMFPLMMTAAGTITPARVFVLGAGVAGLQAIATCRRLGAIVEAFDVRPAVKEEVQSLGATFVAAEALDAAAADAGGYAKEQTEQQQEKQRELLAKHVALADVVITTAAVPGRKAPLLVTEEMVKSMRPGSVIVDLAAESGGNCAVTRPGERVTVNGVVVLGPINIVATVPVHASQMYSRNVQALVGLMVKDGALKLDFTDDILDATCVTHDGTARRGPRGTAAPKSESMAATSGSGGAA